MNYSQSFCNWEQGVTIWNSWRAQLASQNSLTFEETDFSNLDLSGCDFSHVLFYKVKFTGTKLVHADLRCAIFIGVDLTGADLTEANLRGAMLAETDLTKAVTLNALFDQ